MSKKTYREWIINPKNKDAFATWYTEINPELILRIYRITDSDLPLAEDLLHDVVIKFLENMDIKKMEHEAAAVKYIETAARNRWINHLRKQKRQQKHVINYEREEAYEKETPPESLILEDKLDEILRILKGDEKETLQRMVDGKSLLEISQEEGITYSNAGVKVHRIRTKIEKKGLK